MKNACRVLVGKPEKTGDFLKDIGIYSVILKWVLKRECVKLIHQAQASCCEPGIKLLSP
jgi:hypothetical protein